MLGKPLGIIMPERFRAMHGAGFVNYPHEWWHWSYGDRFWGCMTGRAAIYDSVTLRESTTARLLRTLHWAWIQGK